MPVRKEGTKISTVDIVDLGDLPQHYKVRINEIFDSYFSLGMRPSNMVAVADFSPQFPSKLATLSSPDLGDMLGNYTAWYSYTIDKSKYISVALNFVEQELAKVLEEELGQLLLEKGNIEAKKAQAKRSESYKTVYYYTQKLKGLKTLLDTDLQNYDRCISTLSREVSRREVNAGF